MFFIYLNSINLSYQRFLNLFLKNYIHLSQKQICKSQRSSGLFIIEQVKSLIPGKIQGMKTSTFILASRYGGHGIKRVPLPPRQEQYHGILMREACP